MHFSSHFCSACLLLTYVFQSTDPLFNSSLFYEAYILDHVLAENKLGLLEFWAADWNSDKVVDLEEVNS